MRSHRFSLAVVLLVDLAACAPMRQPIVAVPERRFRTENQAAEHLRLPLDAPTRKNLEAFLTRFPQSSRREIVLRTICTYAMQANAPDVAVRRRAARERWRERQLHARETSNDANHPQARRRAS